MMGSCMYGSGAPGRITAADGEAFCTLLERLGIIAALKGGAPVRGAANRRRDRRCRSTSNA